MILKVLPAKEASLRKPSRPVRKIDRKILGIIKDLKDTLGSQKDPEGVGLAAPQIGKNLRIFYINHKKTSLAVINPEVLKLGPLAPEEPKGNEKIMEGCLSLPNFYGSLRRSSWVVIKYISEAGVEKTKEFKGFLAQIIQHEIDHLNGILFVDRLIEQKKSLFKLVGDDWEEVELT